MSRPLIIGYGNLLRSDDGVGQLVAEELARRDEFCGAGIVSCPQLLPDYAWLVSQAERVLVIDAAANLAPGQTMIQQVKPAALVGDVPHEFSPGMVVALAHSLYGNCPPTYLLTVGGENFELGDTLSQNVTACLPAVYDQVQRWLRSSHTSRVVDTASVEE
jgi:hydrogenase maturation protease